MTGSPPHGSNAALKPLSWAFALTGTFFLVELAGGWWTGSLALIADATHMGVDLAALGLSLFAAKMSLRPPDAKRTFGYKRVEVLAALGNGLGLMLLTGAILREAVSRYARPQPIKAPEMVAIATVGLLCNLVSGTILYRSSRENINLRGAFLHVASDAVGSLGAIAAGLVILTTGWRQADAVASGLICVGIVLTAFWLVRDSVHILLEGAPTHLNLEEVRAALSALPGVTEVHDLHLWSLTRGSESMTGHVVVAAGQAPARVLADAAELLKGRFGIAHVTLQIEPGDGCGSDKPC